MIDLDTLQKKLRTLEDNGEEENWPSEALRLLSDAGCWKNVIAREYGGGQTPPIQQLQNYEAVAAGSVSLALILTQHDAACELLGDCDNKELASLLMPRFASGELLATVGISQLTTSRRHGGSAMRAEKTPNGYRLKGFMPWVTSAPKADYIVTGAVLEDDQQILGCLSTKSSGVEIGDPMQLMALRSSFTTEVRCNDVDLPMANVMRGPVEKVLQLRAPVKPLSVSAVGIGLAKAMLADIQEKSPSLTDIRELIEKDIVNQYKSIRSQLYDAVDQLNDPSAEIPAMEIRVNINALIQRLSITLMTLAKGSGYLSVNSAQRLCREAMFFLVWSAPPHVQVGTIRKFWD